MIRERTFFGVRAKYAVAVYVALLLCSTLAATPSARAINWFADEVTVKTENDPNIGFMPVCGYYPLLPVFLTVAKQASPWDSSESVNASGCIEFGKNADMARYFTSTFSTQTRAVRIHGDATFHDYVGPEGVILPESDTQVLTTSAGIAAAPKTRLYTTRNFSTTLKPMMRNSQGVVTSYSADLTKLETWMWDESDTSKQHSVVPVTVSENGRYVIAYVDNKGYVKIDLDRRTVTKILDRVVPSDKPYVTHWNHVGGVSSEGRYVVVGDFQNDATLLVDTENCGDEFGRGFVAPMKSSCRTLDLEKLAEQKTGKNFNGFSKKTFLKDGSLTLESSDVSSGAKMRLTLQKYGHVEPALYYLALGDSYSSGEGDIDKKSDGSSYYIAGTEQDGQCHVSSRSYPYLLRDYWKIPGNKMASVACSGAWVTKDYVGNVIGYDGQHHELRNVGIEAARQIRNDALDAFKQGIVPQIEFVKKYKPKIITLTGGGNDVGFSDIIDYCASPIGNLPASETCGYASSPEMRSMLWDAIHSQYEYSIMLIDEIHKASPDTSVYVIGYPIFIKERPMYCSLNTALLDSDEITMINDATREMNRTLKAAADKTGVRYVDIGDALDGGKLCEGSEYVTGVTDSYGDRHRFDQSFHPNALGHEKIAEIIKREVGSDPYLSSHTSPVTLEQIKTGTPTYPAVLIVNPTVGTEGRMKIKISGGFLPGSVVQLSAFSSPTYLGAIAIDQEGVGEMNVDIISKLKSGRHLLVAEGDSKDGGRLRLYQYFIVKSNSDIASTDLVSQSTQNISKSSVISAQNLEMPELWEDYGKQTMVQSLNTITADGSSTFLDKNLHHSAKLQPSTAPIVETSKKVLIFTAVILLAMASIAGLIVKWSRIDGRKN